MSRAPSACPSLLVAALAVLFGTCAGLAGCSSEPPATLDGPRLIVTESYTADDAGEGAPSRSVRIEATLVDEGEGRVSLANLLLRVTPADGAVTSKLASSLTGVLLSAEVWPRPLTPVPFEAHAALARLQLGVALTKATPGVMDVPLLTLFGAQVGAGQQMQGLTRVEVGASSDTATVSSIGLAGATASWAHASGTLGKGSAKLRGTRGLLGGSSTSVVLTVDSSPDTTTAR